MEKFFTEGSCGMWGNKERGTCLSSQRNDPFEENNKTFDHKEKTLDHPTNLANLWSWRKQTEQVKLDMIQGNTKAIRPTGTSTSKTKTGIQLIRHGFYKAFI